MAFFEDFLRLDKPNGKIIMLLGFITILRFLFSFNLWVLIKSLDLKITRSLYPFWVRTLVVIKLLCFVIVDSHFNDLILVIVILSKERFQAYGGRHWPLFIEGLRKLVFHFLEERERRACILLNEPQYEIIVPKTWRQIIMVELLRNNYFMSLFKFQNKEVLHQVDSL